MVESDKICGNAGAGDDEGEAGDADKGAEEGGEDHIDVEDEQIGGLQIRLELCSDRGSSDLINSESSRSSLQIRSIARAD